MPKFDFYILKEDSQQAKRLFACRLIEKAYKNNHRIYIHTDSQEDAHALDEMLWTYREDSFLPHNLYGEGPQPPPPIQIGWQNVPDKHRDILMNLSSEVPNFYSQFNRVLEIVGNDTPSQEKARERFRYYRSQNHDIQTHKLETAE